MTFITEIGIRTREGSVSLHSAECVMCGEFAPIIHRGYCERCV